MAMMTPDQLHGTLFYGDNLTVLREQIPDESVDLIYLDPPFKSNTTYNILFRDESGDAPPSQIEAFDDTWHWGADSERALAELLSADSPAPQAGQLLESLVRALGRNQMTAYLAMMSVRLAELRRVLKPSGSIYLHCDPTAGHSLKLLLDSIFGPERFQNEIIWRYRRWPAKQKRFQRMHDTIFFYTKDADSPRVFNQPYEDLPPSTVERFGTRRQVADFSSGHRRPGQTEEESPGAPMADVWEIGIIAPSARERVGYDTQKPLRLLRRIIEASSNPGDLILDPFCGCGTAMVAAEELGRRWCGIDITHLAIGLVEDRLRELNTDARVIGAPQDMISARDLARRSALQFEAWAITRLAGFRPNAKQTGDGGIDGRMHFAKNGEGGRDYGRAVAQVKSGSVNRGDLDAFVTALDRDDAQLGVFITLEALGPRHGAHAEAARAGTVRIGDRDYEKIQLWSIEDWFASRRPELPAPIGTQQPRLI